MPPRPGKNKRPDKAKVGRPSEVFPDQFRTFARAAAAEGKDVEHVRQVLLAAGLNIGRKAITDAMTRAPDLTFDPSSDGPAGQSVKAKIDVDGKGIDCPRFTEDIRIVVDDLICEERGAARIRAFLLTEGIDVDVHDLEAYIVERLRVLADDMKSATGLAIRQLSAKIFSLRMKKAHVWAKLPASERYTGKTFAALESEETRAMSLLFDLQKAHDEKSGGDERSILAEIERKLGIQERLIEAEAMIDAGGKGNDRRGEKTGAAS